MLKITQNFDWSITKRKLCIFIPNYGKKESLEFSISQIRTRMPKDDWVVIIGNDGIDIDFSHLQSQNVYYFTLHRQSNDSRNGGFIRNYAIKRCQSEFFFQKDPEIVLLGDFIGNICTSEEPWRAGNIYVLDEKLSAELMLEKNFDILKYSACLKMDPVKVLDANYAKCVVLAEDGRVNFSSYFHYAYAVKTEVLFNLRGYDEQYLYYGYEDSDMFCRLVQIKQHLVPDYDVTAIHLYHDRDVNLEQLKKMRLVFANQNPVIFIRNYDYHEIWGEGGNG